MTTHPWLPNPFIIRLFWKIPRRTCQSFKYKHRILIPARLKNWHTGLQVETPKTSLPSTPKPVGNISLFFSCCQELVYRCCGRFCLHIYISVQLSLFFFCFREGSQLFVVSFQEAETLKQDDAKICARFTHVSEAWLASRNISGATVTSKLFPIFFQWKMFQLTF